ncbi:MAG: transcription-repair coupling factor [Tenericutes bacterium]|nr:transcription-repair coupling factor [Mycoplasmatota bacterium]
MLYNAFNFKIADNDKVDVIGLNNKVQAEYVWNLFGVLKKDILIVTNTIYEANLLYKSLSYSHNNVYLYPMDDFLVSESLASSPDLKAIRIDTLNSLTNNNDDKKILITNLTGYLRFLPTKEIWRESIIKIKKNSEYKREELLDKLNTLGYTKDSIVTKTGEYSNRGYILDIFPYESDLPVRIEFFDDEIESIRYFNSDTQLSLNDIDDVSIMPFTEFINTKKMQDIPSRQSLLPRVLDNYYNIEKYMDSPLSIFMDLDILKQSHAKVLSDIEEFKETDVYKIDKYMFNLEELLPRKYINILSIDNYSSKNIVETYETKEIDRFNGNFNLLNIFINKNFKDSKKVVIVLEDRKILEELSNYLDVKILLTNKDELKENVINVVIGKLYNGFILGDYTVLTANEIFKKQFVAKYKTKFRYGSKIRDINKLQTGDYVVHQLYGIGIYLGITTLTTNGLKKDYLNIEYKDKDKLYIPVEKIELISKFSSSEGVSPKLSKLGSSDWYKQKSRIKGKVKDIAKQLLNLFAQRKLEKGFSFLPDDEMQYNFDNDFPYDETKDQLRSIEEIKLDMEKPHPMDRLLCGDVGYGKTEVAFRAIFKAIRSGKQVAFLCPTTILSKQHYDNALVRFDGYGVNIAVLNRFISVKEKNEILEGLKSGKIDLVIGTHRLLNKDIIFKDLGLLVIDEEQRFGVTHKEKIKAIKANIDVLTLSATPIPRTLQMSLAGMRSLSLIETPPIDRYPVQTYVLKENDYVIKDAIYKELSRDGQVYVLYNKVQDIDRCVYKIQKLVPDAKITFIHGQMSKNEIESTMESFTSGEYNVLVCTTIIETGIDIQNANTLIVLDADHFGLSQLYQIRGRIGRGSNIGYAYLMYDKNKELNSIATKRLSAIKEFTELGSGYSLAMRDLSIRGAGNILGAEQSGFIDSIGYDLYLKILNEEVERLKGHFVENEEKDEKPFLQVSTHINDFYADTEELKIEIHKIINTIDSEEKFEEVKNTLEDRFGKLDETIIIYMQEELFQYLAKKKGVVKVEQLPKVINVYFNDYVSNNTNMFDVLSNLYKINTNYKVEYINKILKISLSLTDLDKHFTYYLIKMLEIME